MIESNTEPVEVKRMWEDPIVQEIRQIREAHAERFNYDLQAIYQDIKEQERQSDRKFVSYPHSLLKP